MKKCSYEKWINYKKQINRNKKYILRHGKTALIYDRWNFVTNRQLNLDNPLGFNEKLQRRKLSKNPLFRMCADKDKVREYVSKKIGKQYLIKQYFSKKKVTLKDLKKLPKSFILKTSNGSGTNRIVYNKNKENLKEIKEEINYYTL